MKVKTKYSNYQVRMERLGEAMYFIYLPFFNKSSERRLEMNREKNMIPNRPIMEKRKAFRSWRCSMVPVDELTQ